jgi:hypothetical protein
MKAISFPETSAPTYLNILMTHITEKSKHSIALISAI